ncbi:MAG TPA: putative molybdenum carrier protein, partial [Xanthobacteraceae bacterium]
GLAVSAGTTLAQDFAHRYRKPVLVAELGEAARVEHAVLWLRVQKARHGDGLKLAIGGPRESEAPGIYVQAAAFIGALI